MGSAQGEHSPALSFGSSTPIRREPLLPMFSYVGHTPAEDTTIGGYWAVIWRRRGTVIAVMVALTTVAAIVSFRTRPVYKAEARVEVSAESPQTESLQSYYERLPSNDNYLRTQIQVLQTDNLAWRTVEQLNLGNGDAFGGSTQSDPQRRRMELINRFKGQLSVELVPGSRVIKVGFESVDPEFAARVTNALVNNYIDYNFRQQYDATRLASVRMEQQLDELKAAVEESQRSLAEYERANAIVTVSDKQNVIEQRLGELSTDLSSAQNDRIQKEALYQQVHTAPAQADALADDELLQKLRENYSNLDNRCVEAQAQYGPTFPKVIRLQKQVEAAQALVDKERSRVVEKIHGEYLAAVNREKLISSAVAQQKDQQGKLNQLLVQHNILKGDFETNQKLYQRLLQQLKDATIAAGLRSTNIHFVDPALTPIVPVRPRKLQNIVVAMFAGLGLGMIIAFGQESLDSSLRAPEDVELLIASPTLGVIPVRRFPNVPKTRRLMGGKSASEAGVALTALNDAKSQPAEAYRALRTAVLLSTSPQPPTSILITSSNAGEGKTSTAVNLAITLAQSGAQVALVDCDMRKPGVVRVLGLRANKGISTVLTRQHDLLDTLQCFAGAKGLYVIGAGPVPPNPAELLSSQAMKQVIEELSQHFRHVIIDSPPILAVTDSTILSSMVDGVVLVVESGATHKKMVLRARRILENAGGRILGVALNKYDARSDGYYGGYYREYPYAEASER